MTGSLRPLFVLAAAAAAVLTARPAAAVPPSIHGMEPPRVPVPPRLDQTYGPAAIGTPTGASGTLKLLVLPIHYSDVNPTEPTDEVAYFEDMFFGTDTTGEGPYPFASMRQFFARQSGGALELTGDVMPWAEASTTQSYYGRRNNQGSNGCWGLGDVNSGFTVQGIESGGAQVLLREALQAATTNAGIDLDDYDSDGDGILDGVVLVHAGPGAEMTAGEGDNNCQDLWSHQYQDSFNVGGETYDVRYLVGPERFRSLDGIDHPAGIGTFAHEFGHILGLPDLYSSSGQGFGTGKYSLMSWGLFRLEGVDEADFGADIAPMGLDPWSMTDLGWANPRVIDANQCSFELAPLNDPVGQADPPILQLNLDDGDASEYFLVSYLLDEGDWGGLDSDSLQIWHVDENWGGGADPPQLNNGPCAPQERPGECSGGHYWLSFEQADGSYELEQGANLGEAGDVFDFGSRFQPEARPWSCSWDGNDCSVSLEVTARTSRGAGLRIVVDPASLPTPPRVVSEPPQQNLRVGEEFRFDFDLKQGDDVSWELALGPPGMTVDPETGEAVWTADAPGEVDVRVHVENCGGSDTVAFTLFVSESAGGGGGCSCAAAGSGGDPGWLLLLLAAGIWRLRRQRNA